MRMLIVPLCITVVMVTHNSLSMDMFNQLFSRQQQAEHKKEPESHNQLQAIQNDSVQQFKQHKQ